MTSRAMRLLHVVITSFAACTSIAVMQPSSYGTPSECLLEKPKTAASPGKRWLLLADRRCWVLRDKIKTPSQAKGSLPSWATLIGTRPTGASTARAADDAATNGLSTQAELPTPPIPKEDGKRESATDATAGPSEHAEQNLSTNGPLNSAEPALRAPASGSPATPSVAAPPVAVQTQETDQNVRMEADPVPAPAAAETMDDARAIEASYVLQMLLLAIFCGPALYLLAVGAIGRLARAVRQ